MPRQGGNGSYPGRYLGGYFRIRQSVVLCYWLIPKSCNCLSCLYTISPGGKAVTFLLPLSQGYLPYKANYCCIFLAAETLLLPIPRRRILRKICQSNRTPLCISRPCLPWQGSWQVTDLMPWRKISCPQCRQKICCSRRGRKNLPWAGNSAMAGNMTDSAQICCVRFTNSAPADAIVAALVGSECHKPGTASVQLPIWLKSAAPFSALGGKNLP
ncbi:hypothetical protein V6N11_056165 [Hibiscus sabdariffa]|uniref:Uncharacterized protein n=1 Tax=Hibiscus sabdariffa TaxID=183260 RepID=A0ABR2T3N1_9ROSI